MQCGNCRFWRPKGDCDLACLGDCRRFPPAIVDGCYNEDTQQLPIYAATWSPQTVSSEWCGEFQPKAPATDS
jgi:hypothetical protein